MDNMLDYFIYKKDIRPAQVRIYNKNTKLRAQTIENLTFEGVNLTDCDFSDAHIGNCIFSG